MNKGFFWSQYFVCEHCGRNSKKDYTYMPQCEHCGSRLKDDNEPITAQGRITETEKFVKSIRTKIRRRRKKFLETASERYIRLKSKTFLSELRAAK